VAFDARKEGNSAQLSWSTTEEVNSDRFEIERSTDGKAWAMIGSIRSNGESSTVKTYNYTDPAPEKGENLYRLRMVDKDDTFAYSRVRSLNWESASQAYLYPNPAAEKVYLNAGQKAVAQVSIVNASGTKISASFQSGYVDVKALPQGVYVLKVTYQDGSASSFKFLRGK
jgi:hypothetical protein